MRARIFQYAFLVVWLTIVPTVGHTAEYWTIGTPMPITGWYSPTAVALQGKIYLFGGYVWGQTPETNFVEMYDPEQDSWQTMTPMPEIRAYMGAAAVDDSIYLFGGLGGGYLKSTVWKYTPALEGTPAGPWCTDLHSIGYPNQPGIERGGGGVVAREGKIYLFGGRYAPFIVPYVYADWQWYSTTWCYDPATDMWAQKASMPSAGSIPAAVVGTKIYLVGGEDPRSLPSGYLSSGLLWAYGTTANVWDTNLPNFGGGTIAYHAVCTINGRVYVAGGYADSAGCVGQPLTWRYDPDARQWEQLAPMPVPTIGPAFTACGGNFYLFNGYSSCAGPYSNLTQILHVVQPTIAATVDIDPNTLNLQSRGKWVTCYISFPADVNVVDVNSNSILLNGKIKAEWNWVEEEEQVMMAKFSRSAVQGILQPGTVELTVSGKLNDETRFEGKDTITVINEGKP